jgi:hypothetical protein
MKGRSISDPTIKCKQTPPQNNNSNTQQPATDHHVELQTSRPLHSCPLRTPGWGLVIGQLHGPWKARTRRRRTSPRSSMAARRRPCVGVKGFLRTTLLTLWTMSVGHSPLPLNYCTSCLMFCAGILLCRCRTQLVSRRPRGGAESSRNVAHCDKDQAQAWGR